MSDKFDEIVQSNAAHAIEKTWRPEVHALRVRLSTVERERDELRAEIERWKEAGDEWVERKRVLTQARDVAIQYHRDASAENERLQASELASEAAAANRRYDELWRSIEPLKAENERLREERAKREADFEPLLDEILLLRAHIKKGQGLVNDMDLRMPEQATEDADGWINSYRIPVGPWHRLLGWARGGW